MSTHRQYQVCLQDAAGAKTLLLVEKVRQGEYRLVAAVGHASLDGLQLSFELDTPSVENLDHNSDSMSCFGRSEHLRLHGPALEFQRDTFRVANLEQLQAGLARLRGSLISCDEF